MRSIRLLKYAYFWIYVNQTFIIAQRFLARKTSYSLDCGHKIESQDNVLNNALSNAIKFSQPNDRIDIEVHSKISGMLLTISDYGIGIPPENLEQFSSRGNIKVREGTSQEKGTGFGMGLMRLYMTLYNGKMEIESGTPSHPKGTRVMFSFENAKPVQKDQNSQAA